MYILQQIFVNKILNITFHFNKIFLKNKIQIYSSKELQQKQIKRQKYLITTNICFENTYNGN